MMLLPLNNIRIELTDQNGTDFIEGNVALRLTTKLPRGLCDDADALDELLLSLIAHVKTLTSNAYDNFPRVLGDRPFHASVPLEEKR
jgi:hypothetical protein